MRLDRPDHHRYAGLTGGMSSGAGYVRGRAASRFLADFSRTMPRCVLLTRRRSGIHFGRPPLAGPCRHISLLKSKPIYRGKLSATSNQDNFSG
jgi:hypothetical protein